ncbi:hypothetical protein CC80DRAFT_458191, partial [Byssothecium circinans]
MVDNVANGFWYNWEYGKMRGATLTLPFYSGAILVSFLSLFVQFSGASFYRVLCFVIHQSRSTTDARDGLFHQQQVILRNAATAPSALWGFVRSAVAWRGKTTAPTRNALPLIIGTIFHIALFGAAALLASRIASMGAGQALILSETCGFPKEIDNPRSANSSQMNERDLLTFNSMILMGRITMTKSMAYVRACYNDDTEEGKGDCGSFVQSQLRGVNASAVYNATCPFGGGACATEFAVRYDSGHLHSNVDLGINNPKMEGVSLRRVTTCAPVKANQYATGWKDGVPEAWARMTNTTAKFYEFGKTKVGCPATSKDAMSDLATFCVTKYMKDNFIKAYTLEALTAYHNYPNASDFTPIPDFAVPNADVSLISIFNRAQYTSAVTDPLFHATNASVVAGFFEATNDLSILGCTEQYQFCNTETTQCTELTGLYSIRNSIESGKLTLSKRQTATFKVLWKVAWSMAMQWAGEFLADGLLRAQDWVFTEKSVRSSALDAQQWQIEAHNLHSLSLAVLQRRIHEHALPESFQIRPGVNSLSQIARPTDPEILDICRRQKTRSAENYSVSVLGMCIILIVGSFLILLDWILIQQIFWFRSITHARSAKKADWTSSGTLQLQKQVLESRGIGSWMATTTDLAFPVLVERGRVFRQLGVREEFQLAHVDTGYGGYDRRSLRGGERQLGYASLGNEADG